MEPGTRAVPHERATVDVLVATFNSGRDLSACLESVVRCIPYDRLIVVDRFSTDDTVAIARRFGAEVHQEEVGLGFARSLALRHARTPFVLFVDSDVIVRRGDFVEAAVAAFRTPRVGAVVGMSIGHSFAYGLPLGLTLLPRRWAERVPIPPGAQGRETYYLQRALRADGLRVRYLANSMEHRGTYRGPGWPEWQGAHTRLAAGFNIWQVGYSFCVILLIHMNSRRPRNVAYTPIFFLKFLRGFLQPSRWRARDRRQLSPV